MRKEYRYAMIAVVVIWLFYITIAIGSIAANTAKIP